VKKSRLQDQLGYIIASVNRQLEEELEERLRPAGVPIEQLRILELLSREERGHSMGEIAAQVLVEAPTMTKIIDRMVSEALVFRSPDPHDRRVVLINLAPGGKILYKRLKGVIIAQEDRLAKRLDGDKAQELRMLLRELLTQDRP
jgi:MarR family transcriptional regulator, organic hydroperoxide resistance regulator